METQTNTKPTLGSAKNANLPKELEAYLAPILSQISVSIKKKFPQITFKSINGWWTNSKRAVKEDFSKIGWPKDKLNIWLKEWINQEVKKIQPHIFKYSYKDKALFLKKKKSSEGKEKDFDHQIESYENVPDKLSEEIEVQEKYAKQKVVLIKNRLESLKKNYDKEIQSIKTRCTDATRQRHPIIKIIARCLDCVEKAYQHIVKEQEAQTDNEAKINSKAAEFYTEKVKEEIKKIENSFKIDPEIWIEEEFRNWAISFDFFDKQVTELISEEE